MYFDIYANPTFPRVAYTVMVLQVFVLYLYSSWQTTFSTIRVLDANYWQALARKSTYFLGKSV